TEYLQQASPADGVPQPDTGLVLGAVADARSTASRDGHRPRFEPLVPPGDLGRYPARLPARLPIRAAPPRPPAPKEFGHTRECTHPAESNLRLLSGSSLRLVLHS